jgi:hypothetical protein
MGVRVKFVKVRCVKIFHLIAKLARSPEHYLT